MNLNPLVILKTQMIVRLAVLSLCVILTSCGANFHLNRAIAKDPTMLQKQVVRVDTMLITKEKILRDTIVSNKYDTINTIKNNVSLRIVRINDTIIVDAICPQDTIFFTKEIKVDKIVYSKKRSVEVILLWVFIIALLLLYLKRLL
tara:strand:- start:5351 stop:5788 length:438 start_codon:yes stop_codon:yes gene_type:complete